MADSFNSYKYHVDLSPLIGLVEREGRAMTYERREYLLHEVDVEKHIYRLHSSISIASENSVFRQIFSTIFVERNICSL